MVALRSQGNWRWEGPLGTPLGLVHWKRASSPVEAGTAGYLLFQTPIAGSLQTGDRRVRPRLGLRHGTPLASRDVPGERGRLSSCLWNLAFFSERCTEKLPLRVDFIHRVEFGVVSGHRVLIKRRPGNRGPTECRTTQEATSGMSSSDRPHPEVRQEGREPLPDKAGESNLLSRSGGEKGLRGGGAGKPRCSSRGRPGFRGTLWVASRVPSALSTSNS